MSVAQRQKIVAGLELGMFAGVLLALFIVTGVSP